MDKTIGDLAREYAENMCPTEDYCGGVYDEQRNDDLPIYIDDAKSVLEWLFNKPLSERLTAEEKESIKGTYKHHLNAIGDCYAHCMVRAELERIFGKEMFT